MKIVFKILKWFTIVVTVLVVGVVIFVFVRSDRKYEAPYPDITAVSHPEVLERGEYLVYGPGHCAHCHAPTSSFQQVELGERVPLSGGFNFELPIGTIYAPNITMDEETGIGSFTDGEIARALRHGVKKNGDPLFDFMPFYDLSDEDLTAIISYLRTTKPVKNERPENELNFMGKAVRAVGMIKPMGDGEVPEVPPKDSTMIYGKYLANSVANCRGCHTPRNLQTGAWAGEFYSGGFPMEAITEDGKVSKEKHLVSPNLTPHPETGRIADWDKETFLKRFKTGRVIPGSPMPWGPFSTMSELELTAIYKYLKSLEPVDKEIPLGIQDGPAAQGS